MRYGSESNPPNRFQPIRLEADFDHLACDEEHPEAGGDRQIEYLADESRSIVSRNESPDIPFRYSLNPYRGCVHGCSYCYARPTHEYLSFSAGRDFETKIVVKPDAARLFRDFLARPSWKPEPIMFSGVTDCYQPAERHFQLTRACLATALECRQPVRIITKNALIERDLDILREMAARRLIHVFLSITSLDAELARQMEPRTSIPAARLRAVRTLRDAGVPVGVMVAPLIPGLNDETMPAVLEAAQRAGALTATHTLVRLPLAVAPIFAEWLHRAVPQRAERVLGRIRQTHHGKLNENEWGARMTGSGPIAEQIGQLFQLLKRRYRLDQPLPPLTTEDFRPPSSATGQGWLF